MVKSKRTIEQWLDALVQGRKPNGERTTVTRVNDGDVVEVWYSGGQHFGSGGFYAGAVYAGNEPEKVTEGNCKGNCKYNSFISESRAFFRLTAPSVVYEYSGDGINDGRTFRNHVFVCATDEQIAEAQKRVAEQRRAETKAADPAMPNLKSALKADWQYYEDHRRDRNMGKGYSCSDCSDCYTYTVAQRVYDMLSNPGQSSPYYLTLSDEGFMQKYLSPEAASELRLAMSFATAEERLKIFREAEAEYEAEKKAKGKAFARSQIDKLVEMGFSRGCAVKIMRTAGPGRCIQAVEWAYKARDIIAGRYRNAWGEAEEASNGERLAAAVDALDCLLSGAGGTNGFGKDRMKGVLRAFGLEPPSVSSSRALFRVLAGAKAALLAGLPSTAEPEESTEAEATA